jgi:hypothetical protein
VTGSELLGCAYIHQNGLSAAGLEFFFEGRGFELLLSLSGIAGSKSSQTAQHDGGKTNAIHDSHTTKLTQDGALRFMGGPFSRKVHLCRSNGGI